MFICFSSKPSNYLVSFLKSSLTRKMWTLNSLSPLLLASLQRLIARSITHGKLFSCDILETFGNIENEWRLNSRKIFIKCAIILCWNAETHTRSDDENIMISLFLWRVHFRPSSQYSYSQFHFRFIQIPSCWNPKQRKKWSDQLIVNIISETWFHSFTTRHFPLIELWVIKTKTRCCLTFTEYFEHERAGWVISTFRSVLSILSNFMVIAWKRGLDRQKSTNTMRGGSGHASLVSYKNISEIPSTTLEIPAKKFFKVYLHLPFHHISFKISKKDQK